MRHIMLSVLLLSFSIATHGQLYKWVDKDGGTQYSDRPPPPGAARGEERLDTKAKSAQPAADKESTPKNLVERELEFKKRRAAEEKAEIGRKAEVERNKEKCTLANSRLRIFRDSPRLIVPDGAGGTVLADDAARQKGIDETQKDVAAYCK